MVFDRVSERNGAAAQTNSNFDLIDSWKASRQKGNTFTDTSTPLEEANHDPIAAHLNKLMEDVRSSSQDPQSLAKDMNVLGEDGFQLVHDVALNPKAVSVADDLRESTAQFSRALDLLKQGKIVEAQGILQQSAAFVKDDLVTLYDYETDKDLPAKTNKPAGDRLPQSDLGLPSLFGSTPEAGRISDGIAADVPDSQ